MTLRVKVGGERDTSSLSLSKMFEEESMKKKIYRAVVEITDPANYEPYTRPQIAQMLEDSSYNARMASVEVKCIELTEVKE